MYVDFILCLPFYHISTFMYRNCYMEHPMNKRSFTIMDNENLLNSIYQNIAMVLETIPEIRKITTDCDFKALIISQEEDIKIYQIL